MQSPSVVYQLLVCHSKVVHYSCMSTSVLANTNDGELVGSKLSLCLLFRLSTIVPS